MILYDRHVATTLALAFLMFTQSTILVAAIKLSNATHDVWPNLSISSHYPTTTSIKRGNQSPSTIVDKRVVHATTLLHTSHDDQASDIESSSSRSESDATRSFHLSTASQSRASSANILADGCTIDLAVSLAGQTPEISRTDILPIETTHTGSIQGYRDDIDIAVVNSDHADTLNTEATRSTTSVKLDTAKPYFATPKDSKSLEAYNSGALKPRGSFCFPNRLPSGSDSTYNDNSYTSTGGSSKTTAQVREYHFTISRAILSPDGVSRDMIVVNGQFPGPLIEANAGDTISVTVHNNITQPEEGTALHWHGFLQRDTPWQDGVPSVSQCPIAPGHSYRYEFVASEVGTSFYHAHYSAQYTAGVAGPIVVYDSSEHDGSVEYDCDIGPVMITDWYHIPYFTVVSNVVGNNASLLPPISDNSLIQGVGAFDCNSDFYGGENEKYLASGIRSNHTIACQEPPPPASFFFQAGRTHKLRLINHGSDGIQKVSIDNVNMTIIAIDFVPVRPRTVTTVSLAVAQRVDVLVHAPNDRSLSYWMRALNEGGVTCGGSTQKEVKAAIYHEDSDTRVLPTSSAAAIVSPPVDACINDDISLDRPRVEIMPLPATVQQDVTLKLERNETGHSLWTVNDVSYKADYSRPLLLENANRASVAPFQRQWNVYDFGTNESIILNVTNQTPFAHPFHLHGYNFFILHEGPGLWDGEVINKNNPLRRDTHTIRSLGHIALQITVDNPGIWPFHCHVAWHLSGGLAMNLMVKRNDAAPPERVRDLTCKAWREYTSQNAVDQIDAGS